MSADPLGKLQRYRRKDYSELVAFPVEIVGRDGAVRRYGFEDAIRLYHRRIAFARVRYRDAELVEAEIGHCQRRIAQLRRSYFFRFGWGHAPDKPSPAEQFGSRAGEVAAFLRRVLRVQGRPDIEVAAMAPRFGGATSWRVVERGGVGPLELHAFPFDDLHDDDTRGRFFAAIERLEGDVEPTRSDRVVLGFHHTADVGLLLAGSGADFEHLASRATYVDETGDPRPLDDIREAVRRGRYESALERCREQVAEQPWSRAAYVLGAALAAWLDRGVELEELATVGGLYFPNEPALAYWRAVARLRADDPAGVIAQVGQGSEPTEPLSARLLLAWAHARTLRFARLQRVLQATIPLLVDDRTACAALLRLRRIDRTRRLLDATGVAWSVLGACVALVVVPVGLALVIAGVSVALGGRAWARRRVLELVHAYPFDELRAWVSWGLDDPAASAGPLVS